MSGRADYEDRRQARIDRLKAKASAARDEASGYMQRSDNIAERFAGGQPILIGHHSEKQARRDREKVWNLAGKSVEATEKAEHYESAAEAAAQNGSISSDDPEAVAKLEEKVAALEDEQRTMKAVNAYYRKHKTCVGCEGISDAAAQKLDESMKTAYSWETAPFPSYSLTNINARIKAAKKRIEKLESLDKMPALLIEFPEGEIECDLDENRVIIRFDEQRKGDDTTEQLKGSGFHWSPTNKAWQRMRTWNALYAAARICGISREELNAKIKGGAND